MLIGEYCHNVDLKGRVIIPSKFRGDLGNDFVISKGFDNCLAVYSKNEWEIFTQKIICQPMAKTRKLRAFLFSGACHCETDSHGRAVIPQNLREYAGIHKDVVVIGVSDHAEIWSKEKWEQYTSCDDFSAESVSAAMEELGL